MSEITSADTSISFKEKVTIDFLTLANHVEAVNGLLYMSGGGWTDHNRVIPATGQAPISHFGIGVSVCVPWNETNQPHRLTLTVENEDATYVSWPLKLRSTWDVLLNFHLDRSSMPLSG